MRIGVISDTHIPEQAEDLPQDIYSAFRATDMVIHTGDLTDLIVLDKLKSVCKDIKAVWGNMDSYDVRKRLPEKDTFKIGNYKIAIMHGYGHPNKLVDLVTEIFKADSPDLIIFGHSHTPLNEKKGGILYFNPGSPTDRVFAPYNSYGIIEINDKIESKIIKI